MAQRRLFYAKPFGRPGKMQLLSDRHEMAKMPELHILASCALAVQANGRAFRTRIADAGTQLKLLD